MKTRTMIATGITTLIILVLAVLFYIPQAPYSEYKTEDNRYIAKQLLIKIRNNDYAHVEGYLDYLNKDKIITPYGITKLEVIYRFLSEAKTEDQFETIDKWCKSTSHYSSYIVRGKMLYHKAYNIRGTGWSSSVSDNQRYNMRKLMLLAQEDFEKAYTINPNDPNSAASMVIICNPLGCEEPVMEKWFQRAIKADPIAISSYYNKLYYLMPKWHGTAEKFYKFAIDCYKNSPEGSRVYSVMWLYLYELGNRSGDFAKFYEQEPVKNAFEELLNRLYKDYPDSFYPRKLKAELNKKIGNYEKALELYGEAIEIYPNSSDLLYERGRIYYTRKRYDDAEKDFLKATEIDPLKHDAIYMLGLLSLHYPNKTKDAIKYLDKALTLSDELPYRRARANAAYRMRDKEKCIEDYTNVIERDGGNYNAHYQRGKCYQFKAEYDSALNDLSKALSFSPNNSFALTSRASVFSKLGQFENAIKDYETLIKSEPSNKGYKTNLSVLREKMRGHSNN